MGPIPTTEEFVVKASRIHNNYYTYSKCVYKKSQEKVCIVCPRHGDFWQTPNKHLKGRGCPACGGTSKSSTENFIRKSKTIHSNKYTYDKCIYINSRTKVCITCPRHGNFWQTPCEHLRGKGCNECGGSNKLTLVKFISMANKKHNGKFNYSKCVYNGNKEKICIICPTHGDFWQTPNSHLKGVGCPNCKNSRGENIIVNFLNEHKINFEKNKSFDGCKYKKQLIFDFFIPKLNLCIEFDGIQHFKPIMRFGGIDEFIQNVKRDNIKTEYCKDNNISLLRIKYTDFKNIESILESILNVYAV